MSNVDKLVFVTLFLCTSDLSASINAADMSLIAVPVFSSWFPIWSSLRTVFILSIHQSSSYEATEACAKTAVNRNGRALLPLPFLLLISHKHRFTIHTSIHHVITRKPFHLDIAAFVLESRCITHFPW